MAAMSGRTGFSQRHYSTPLLPTRDINHARQTDCRFSVRGVFRRYRTDRRTDGRRTVAYPLSAEGSMRQT